MAQLHSIIGSILRDIISAQHDANLFSCSLSESYGKEGKTRDFQLPGVVISDMELELKYGVISAEESCEHFNIRIDKVRAFLRELCRDCAKKILASCTATVLDRDTSRPDELKTFFSNLRGNPDVSRQFHMFLSRNMANAFNGFIREAVDQDTGKLMADKVLDRIMLTLRKKFFFDSDLDELFDGTDGAALRDLLMSESERIIRNKIQEESKDENFKRRRSFPQLDVAITSDELAKLPEDAVHSFKFRFSPASCSITSLEDDGWLEDFDMKSMNT